MGEKFGGKISGNHSNQSIDMCGGRAVSSISLVRTPRRCGLRRLVSGHCAGDHIGEESLGHHHHPPHPDLRQACVGEESLHQDHHPPHPDLHQAYVGEETAALNQAHIALYQTHIGEEMAPMVTLW